MAAPRSRLPSGWGSETGTTVRVERLGTGGFTIVAELRYASTGRSIHGGQDVNGDEIPDLVVGAPVRRSPGAPSAGAAFVVFGGRSSRPVYLGAASTHLEKDQGVTHNRYAAAWADQASNHMANHYGGKVELFAIGGDFNAKRCVGPEDEDVAIPTESPEQQVCTERPWWVTMVRENGYDDDIFTDHGDPLKGNTKADLDRQYADGTRTRDKRIDFVFSRMAGDPVASSFDITCGMDTDFDTCKDPLWNPARYSDHRIVWSVLTPARSGNT